VGEHVGQADERRLSLDLGIVVALDGGGDRGGQAPAAHQHAAHERVVDTELATLAVHPVLGGFRPAMHLGRVPGVGEHQHELAHVVQEARDREPVAVLVADFAGDAVGGMLGGQGVQAKALGRTLPYAGALEEVKRPHSRGEAVHRLGCQ
jgi:hypothetical protein